MSWQVGHVERRPWPVLRPDAEERIRMIEETCALKPDCRHLAKVAKLIAKYAGRVPRYTSYPTAAQFTPQIGEAEHRAWLAGIDPAAPVSLYVHVPFCDRLCWYCGCHTGVVHRRAPVADYVSTLVREIDIVGALAPAGLHVSALHFGGGTPNMLAPDDLAAILGALTRHFALADGYEFAAELDPRVLGAEWIEAAAALGLTRASLGVQDLDPRVQAAINRRQSFTQVEWAVRRLRAAGIGSINLDLMYGLPHQTVETVLASLDQVLSLAPERIALFGYAHVPWMKPHQKLISEADLPDAVERFEQQDAAAERLERAGYVRIGLDHFAKPDDALAKAARLGRLRRNFQGYTADAAPALVGFGASSISAFREGYAQNEPRVQEWRRHIEQGRLATARGLTIAPADRVRGAIIERLMCDFAVDLAGVCALHELPVSTFAPELFRLREMEADGLVRRRRAHLHVTRSGRPFVRTIASVFDPTCDPARAGRHAPSV